MDNQEEMQLPFFNVSGLNVSGDRAGGEWLENFTQAILPLDIPSTGGVSGPIGTGGGNGGGGMEYIFDKGYIRVIFLILYSIVFCFCFFGNLAVVLVVTLHWRMRNTTKFCLGNLAFANLCVGIFCVYQNLSTYLMDSWVFGHFMCKMYHFINSLSHTASILILVVLCVERYLAILHPFKCRQLMTITRLRIVIVGVWTMSAILCSPRLYYMTTYKIPAPDDQGGTKYDIICAPQQNLYDTHLADMIYFVLLFLLPLLIISILYTRVGLFLWKSSMLMDANFPQHPSIHNNHSIGSEYSSMVNQSSSGSDTSSSRSRRSRKLRRSYKMRRITRKFRPGRLKRQRFSSPTQSMRGGNVQESCRNPSRETTALEIQIETLLATANGDCKGFSGTSPCNGGPPCNTPNNTSSSPRNSFLYPSEGTFEINNGYCATPTTLEGNMAQSDPRTDQNGKVWSRENSGEIPNYSSGSTQPSSSDSANSFKDTFKVMTPSRTPSRSCNGDVSSRNPGGPPETGESHKNNPTRRLTYLAKRRAFRGQARNDLDCPTQVFTQKEMSSGRKGHRCEELIIVPHPETLHDLSPVSPSGHILTSNGGLNNNNSPVGRGHNRPMLTPTIPSSATTTTASTPSSSHPHLHRARFKISRQHHATNNALLLHQQKVYDQERRTKLLKPRQAVVRMLIVIVVTFAVCNLPFHLRKICQNYVYSYDVGTNFSILITSLTFLLMYLNCAINPILYAFMSKSFRASLKDLMGCRMSRRLGRRRGSNTL